MFKSRAAAGKELAAKLSAYKDQEDTIVLGIPRGGVVVAHEIAKELHLPLDVVIVRKIGVPGFEEVALGAASEDDYILNEDVAAMCHFPKPFIETLATAKMDEVKERIKKFRKKPLSVKDKTVILVDDGVATGATMLLAIKILKMKAPRKIVIALPVAQLDVAEKIAKEVDVLICLLKVDVLEGVSQFYEDFRQIEDEEVLEYLKA